MIDVGLFDGCFPLQESATLGGDNIGVAPKYIKWQRDQVLPVTFFTDTNLTRVREFGNRFKKVALLVEPPSISDTHYFEAYRLQDEFDFILCFDRDFLNFVNNPDKWFYYTFGGSWIKDEDWGLFEKTKNVSLFVSEKRKALGHTFRMQVARMSDLYDIDVYGRGYNPVQTKIIGLRNYRYSIVIESIRTEGYFSEKIIDCISQGTVPIYWGTSDIGDIFDPGGIIQFDNLDDLASILVNQTSDEDYQNRLFSIENNIALAKSYKCAEDRIFAKNPQIFGL